MAACRIRGPAPLGLPVVTLEATRRLLCPTRAPPSQQGQGGDGNRAARWLWLSCGAFRW